MDLIRVCFLDLGYLARLDGNGRVLLYLQPRRRRVKCNVGLQWLGEALTKTALLALPQWLTESDALEVEDQPAEMMKEDDQFHLQAALRAKAGKVLKTNIDFLEELECCKDLPSLHTWAAAYNIELRTYSRLAYRQLYENDLPLMDLLNALEDSALNNPENLDFLLRRLAPIPLTLQNAKIFGDWIQRTLSLGQRSQPQISLLSDFILHVSTVTPEQDQEEMKCSLLAAVFEGLRSSTVFGVKDLDHRTWGVLLNTTTRGTFDQKSLKLGYQMVQALDPSQSSHLVHSISLFIQTDIQAQSSMQATDLWRAQRVNSIPRSFELLRVLPRSTACRISLDVSKALVNHTVCLPESNIPLIKLLDQWWYWIRRADFLEPIRQGTNKRHLERLLIGKSPVIVAAYLRHLDDTEIAHFILRRVFGAGMDIDDRNGAMNLFRQLCKDREDQSPFISMLQAAHRYFELPDRGMQQTFSLLQMLHKSVLIVDIIVGLRESNIMISERVILHTIRTGLHWKHHKAEAIFSVYEELPLEKCPELAERMIMNFKRDPKEAIVRYQQRHPHHKAPSCREPPETLTARAQLLQRMALAYSNAKHLTHQLAFDLVYECYIQHMSDGLGPRNFGTGTILALVQTGIIRPLELGKWVSTSRIRWLLELIGKHESLQVADQVDRALYEWRGINMRRMQDVYHQRKRDGTGLKDGPKSFRFSNRWNIRTDRAMLILKPIKEHDSDGVLDLLAPAKL